MEALTTAALLGFAALDTSGITMQLVLPLAGDAERRTIQYQCEGVEQLFSVDYVDAAPNFLALIPVGGSRLIFAAALADSGARYVSGPFEWSVSADAATFADLRQEDESPVACTEASEIP